MSSINWALDHLGWLLMAFIGFTIGLIAMIFGNFLGISFWAMAAALTVALALWLFADTVIDRLFNSGIGFAARKLGASEDDVTNFDNHTRWTEKTSRIALALGVVVAFLAGHIIDPMSILEQF